MRKKYSILLFCLGVFILLAAGYTTWNMLDPKNTCAQCHEVAPSHAQWQTSAHAGIQCVECHGTALSNGYHSLKEKVGMVFVHFTQNKKNEDLHLSEDQILDISKRCISCHQSEYAGWLISGHAVNYKEIFMDSTHNAMEKPYWDCLRCHGMFYDGNINDLMLLEDENPSHWKIKDKKQEIKPTVPCLACHQIHTENPVSKRYTSMSDSSRITLRNPKTSLYMRADKMYMRADHLTPVTMMDEERVVKMAQDPNTLLCMQCHSPNYAHAAGTEDDRTPVGVHEGFSCITCHKPHSGETLQSCYECHPSLTQDDIDKVYANPHRTYPTLKTSSIQ